MIFLRITGWFAAFTLLVCTCRGQDEPRHTINLDLKAPELKNPDLKTPEIDVRRDATVLAVERAMPSVVNVATENVRPMRDPMQDVLEQFWGPFYQRRERDEPYSLGSGVIISEDGYILTNDHVVQRANKIWVKLATGGDVYEAKLISTNPKKDISLLKIVAPPETKFTAIKFGEDDDLMLGETVLALGNPFNLGGSVSRGILSSKSRVEARDDEPWSLYNYLQTDAAINPGNSGGPLVNLRGDLIGLNSVILAGAQGVGFAIPAKQINAALSGLATPETAKGLWFGARVKNERDRIVISYVQAGSPAALAGIRVGDTVQQVDGVTPKNLMNFSQLLVESQRAKVSLKISRSDGEQTIPVKLIPEASFFNAQLVQKKLGLTLQQNSQGLAEANGLLTPDGFIVTEVETNGPSKDVKAGFIIKTFDGQTPADVKDVAKMLFDKKAGDKVQLGIFWQQRVNYSVRYGTQTTEVTVRP